MSAFSPPGHPDHSEKGEGKDKHTNCFSTTEYSRGQSSLTRRPIMTIKDSMFVHFCVQIKQRYTEGACTYTQCNSTHTAELYIYSIPNMLGQSLVGQGPRGNRVHPTSLPRLQHITLPSGMAAHAKQAHISTATVDTGIPRLSV